MRISPSKMARWIKCQRRAHYEETEQAPDPRAPTHIAAHVGTMAHALLAGDDTPATPDVLNHDAVTPTMHVAKQQANSIFHSASALLAQQGLEVLEREREVSEEWEGVGIDGTTDLLCMEQTPNGPDYFIIDLKTGQRPDGAWLQLGSYAIASLDTLKGEHPDLDAMNLHVAVLWVPRMRTHEVQHAAMESRAALAVMQDSAQVADMIENLLEGRVKPVPNPGMQCASCPINHKCAVSTTKEGAYQWQK